MICVANSTENSEVAKGLSKSLEYNFLIIDFSLSDPDFQSAERRNERNLICKRSKIQRMVSFPASPLTATISSPVLTVRTQKLKLSTHHLIVHSLAQSLPSQAPRELAFPAIPAWLCWPICPLPCRLLRLTTSRSSTLRASCPGGLVAPSSTTRTMGSPYRR